MKKCIDIYLSYKDKTLDKELTKKIKNNNIEKSGSINSSIKDTLFDEKHNDLKPDPELTDEINFEEIDEKIYQYQQLSKFFDVEPKNLFSIKEGILNEIDSLENFEKEKKNDV